MAVLIVAGGLVTATPESALGQLNVQVALTWEYGDGGWRAYRPVYSPREVVYYTPSRRVRVPPGHMPVPGYCRVWYPGVPPGHQPRAERCERIFRRHYAAGVVILGAPGYRGPDYRVGWYGDDDWDDDRGRGRGRGRGKH